MTYDFIRLEENAPRANKRNRSFSIQMKPTSGSPYATYLDSVPYEYYREILKTRPSEIEWIYDDQAGEFIDLHVNNAGILEAS